MTPWLTIVVNCGPSESYIEQCLDSVRSQTFQDWEAYVTVDACHDRTYARGVRARARDRRIHIRRNKQRMYSMANLIQAVRRSRAKPHDVIAMLDGDDWFAHDDALRTIADTYARHDCWMTYGSWVSNVAGATAPRGLWPAYPEHTTDFRRARWLATAVRTWKKWLWDRIDDSDLRDATGNYYRASEDQAVMLPLLEMSTVAKARHIADPIMVYNQLNPHASCFYMAGEMQRNAVHLANRTPYRPLVAHPHARPQSAQNSASKESASQGCSNAASLGSPAHGLLPRDTLDA